MKDDQPRNLIFDINQVDYTKQEVVVEKKEIDEILENNTFVENLRDGILFQDGSYKDNNLNRFRGHSANI